VHKQFWPLVCQLADVYDDQGLTQDERQRHVTELFSAMPPQVQRRVMDCTLRLSMKLPDLYAAIVAAANRSEERSGESTWKKADTA